MQTSLVPLPGGGYPFPSANGLAASGFALQPFNNPNYNNYYNGPTPNYVPQKIYQNPSQFQTFVEFSLATFNKKLVYFMDVLSQLWFTRPEFENSYEMETTLFIQHALKQTAVALTTLQGKGTDVPLQTFKQVRVKPSQFLSFEHKIPIYNYNSQSENVKRSYLLSILEGIMMQTRKLMLMTVQALFECYNFLDHLLPNELLELCTNIVRGAGILNRGTVDVMTPIQYLADSIRTIMAYTSIDLIFCFYPQALQQVLVKANCWKYSSGQQLFEENLVVPQFITVRQAENDMLGDGGTLRLISNPSTGKFSHIDDNLDTFMKLRRVYFIRKSDADAGVFIETAAHKFKRVDSAYLDSLIAKHAGVVGPANGSDYYMFIPQTSIINGNPISMAGTSGPGNPRPLQSIEGHLSSTEGENLGTQERVYMMKKAIRIHPAYPDAVRLIPCAVVKNVFMAPDSSCLASTEKDNNSFACGVAESRYANISSSVTQTGQDFISWNTLSQFLGTALNTLVETDPNFVTTLTPAIKDEAKLYICMNLSNSQTGCLMSSYSIAGPDPNTITIPSNMNPTNEGLLPVVLNQPHTSSYLRAAPATKYDMSAPFRI